MDTGVNAPMPNKSFGKEFIFAVVVIVIALGAGYMIYQKSNMPAPEITTNTSSDPVVQKITVQSSSDDTDSIDADLKATDFSGLGN